MLFPKYESAEPFGSKEEPKGRLGDGMDAAKAELWTGIMLPGTTGNSGWETGTGAVDAGSPGGVMDTGGWSPGGAVDGMGGLIFWTGNNGCGGNPKGAGGGTETPGCWGYHGCGRAETAQPTGGIGTAGL